MNTVLRELAELIVSERVRGGISSVAPHVVHRIELAVPPPPPAVITVQAEPIDLKPLTAIVQKLDALLDRPQPTPVVKLEKFSEQALADANQRLIEAVIAGLAAIVEKLAAILARPAAAPIVNVEPTPITVENRIEKVAGKVTVTGTDGKTVTARVDPGT